MKGSHLKINLSQSFCRFNVNRMLGTCSSVAHVFPSHLRLKECQKQFFYYFRMKKKIFTIIKYAPSDLLGRVYTLTDLLFSLQSTHNPKLHIYEYLVCFSNINIMHSYYEVSYYMPHKIVNFMLV